MKFKGLDNFRSELKEFIVDIQDVVRSAILDGVDISDYIEDCSNNPYKLEQIRLAMKENLSKDYFRLSGDSIYQIRKLNSRGVALSHIEKQLKSNLSDEYMSYLVRWVDEGINVSKLNIAIIPKNLLETFDYGLSKGFDMSIFNTGISYTSKYIMLCLQIAKNGKPISFLLNGDYSIASLEVLVKFSKVSETHWERLISVIDCNTSSERVYLLCNLCKTNLDLNVLQRRDQGKYVYANSCLSVLVEAFTANLDLKELLLETDPSAMKSKKDAMVLKSKRKVSGRFVKN